MQDDQPHAFQDALLDLRRVFVGDLVVGAMAPPGHDVGLGQDGVREPLALVAEFGHAHRSDAGLFSEVAGNGLAHALGVDIHDLPVAFVVHALVPYRDAESVFHGRSFPWRFVKPGDILAARANRVKRPAGHRFSPRFISSGTRARGETRARAAGRRRARSNSLR